MTAEDRDEQRGEIIGRLEHRYQQAQAKDLKAKAEAAEAQREFAELQAARHRAQLPLPAGDVCLDCWINHGRISNYCAIPSDDPERYDLMKCEGCGRIDERETER